MVGNNGLIYYTRNAGEKWNKMNSGVTSNLESVFFYESGIGFAVGENGTILKYHPSAKMMETKE
jgi:photosystem II stability/assembly factor-like uncharacterized protein